MGSNRLGEAASFELPSLAGLLGADAGNGPDSAKGNPQVLHNSVMFPMLQVLRLQDNSIRNIQGLQLYGFTGNSVVMGIAVPQHASHVVGLRACHE